MYICTYVSVHEREIEHMHIHIFMQLGSLGCLQISGAAQGLLAHLTDLLLMLGSLVFSGNKLRPQSDKQFGRALKGV